MAGELDELISKVRERVQGKEQASLASILCDLGVSPENQQQVMTVLGGLGYDEAQLSDAGKLKEIAQELLSSMPQGTRHELAGMVSRVVADMNSGVVPAEVAGFVSALERGPDEKDNPGDPAQSLEEG